MPTSTSAPRGSTPRPSTPRPSTPRPRYVSTFIFEQKDEDEQFLKLDSEIAERARTIPGFLGEEAWHDESRNMHAEVYYWASKESLQQLVGMDTHRQAKGLYERWIGRYRVVISEVQSVYGDADFGLSHQPA